MHEDYASVGTPWRRPVKCRAVSPSPGYSILSFVAVSAGQFRMDQQMLFYFYSNKHPEQEHGHRDPCGKLIYLSIGKHLTMWDEMHRLCGFYLATGHQIIFPGLNPCLGPYSPSSTLQRHYVHPPKPGVTGATLSLSMTACATESQPSTA